MDTDRYDEDSTVDLLDRIEACLARIKDRINVHGSAESAEHALAEVRRRLSDEEAERLRGEIAGRIELARCRAEFHDSDIARRDAEIARLRAEADGLSWELSKLRSDYSGACAKLRDCKERAEKAEAAIEAVHALVAPWGDK